jgi:hypothetical protein
MSELPDLAAFSECVGETFRERQESGEPLELELVEAEALPVHEGSVRKDPFSLLFRGPPGHALAQRTYTVVHERLGEVALFMVPVGMKEEGILLEAVVN